MFSPISPEPEPASFVCSSCGTPRITSAPEACYECGQEMPRYYGRVPGKQERPQVIYLTNPLWVILGAVYLGCLEVALVFVTRAPGILILLTILAVPPLCRTIY